MGFLKGYARKLGVLEYLGTWNASTNTPNLQSSQGQKNGYYVVSVTGSTSLDGVSGWEVGDWAIFNGEKWEQIDNQNKNADISTHINRVDNPHNVTKDQIGLSNVNNTSDMNKPVSTAQKEEINKTAYYFAIVL